MKLIFPFKNMTLNALAEFFEIKKVKHFARAKKNQGISEQESFNSDVEYFRNTLPNFESEILQIINTTNQESIDHYFSTLKEELHYFLRMLEKDALAGQVDEWNQRAKAEYDKLVLEKEEKYFQQPERDKYEHLEEYERSHYLGLFSHTILETTPYYSKQRVTNYNYYCVKDVPDTIPLDCIEEYHKLRKKLTSELSEISAKYGEEWIKGNLSTGQNRAGRGIG